MLKRYRFNKIAKDIKEIKIQGATNIAKQALKAYYLFPNRITKRVLLNLRPTEPMLSHVLALVDRIPKEEILNHFSSAQEKINKIVFKLIKDNQIILTHCHSTNVVKALIYAKKNGKRFEVYNTETRPLFQGRETANELSRAGIKVTNFVDSAVGIALKQQQGTKKVDLVFLGADALLENSVVNKVGSGVISELAFNANIPVYIIADSWKYAHKVIKLEQRDFHEVWGTKRVHVKNPAFEIVDKKFIKAIITELGLIAYEDFITKVRKQEYY